jgi:hypothetical protein
MATCACGCQRHAHANGGIGECLASKLACHGCPEYRPAQSSKFAELDDAEIDGTNPEQIRCQYRALRAHHIEETSYLYDQLSDQRALVEDDVIERRGVHLDDICTTCHGMGVTSYSNTSTWRKGFGGRAITQGICDACWGSGDKDHPWMNLRTMEVDIRRQIAEQAVDALARSCGASLSPTTTMSIKEIIEQLDLMTRKRKISFWTDELANGLANVLRRAIGEPEKKL